MAAKRKTKATKAPVEAAPTALVNLGALAEANTFDGFTAADLIFGLHGVCTAMDRLLIESPWRVSNSKEGFESACELAQASKVLSSMLNKAVHS